MYVITEVCTGQGTYRVSCSVVVMVTMLRISIEQTIHSTHSHSPISPLTLSPLTSSTLSTHTFLSLSPFTLHSLSPHSHSPLTPPSHTLHSHSTHSLHLHSPLTLSLSLSPLSSPTLSTHSLIIPKPGLVSFGICVQ